ncbi:type 1 glutamine amidotransferase domain-containing protein [Streptomyces sp. ISL-44]|uniref:type 1 glutamine amidotransferase domain-containing protein n=1 Tax=Streptomyces sp. ISL-44 TaxID=2819184 RepID=UPI001BE94702|nr:type 1 glutamine amidotransferase domain-containing protein [Streptomyces sp. ISL-44]MBT2542665.1 type 1 glutamine amidotransferase domain-containing protein [Streptomyces sp. ISL-44]
MSDTRKVAFILTSHGKLGSTGRSTGFYLPEAAHPWKALSDAGFEVHLFSVADGRPPMDGQDLSDPVQQAFLDNPRMSAQLDHTPNAEEIDPARYAAILFVGGHGAMWDFPGNTALSDAARDIYEAGGAIAAVCHGPAALVDITLSDGSYLVADKNLAAFTNDEEAALGLTKVVPFLLQSKLEERGASHTGAAEFGPHVVVDGRLVTGQNPASAAGVGEALARVLSEQSA